MSGPTAFRVSALMRTPLWVRVALSAVCGALATLAMPPWQAWPVLWIALPVLYGAVLSTRARRDAVLIGWSFGFGHFATGFAWITNAFYVDRETFAALAVPAIGALAAGFALYIAVAALAAIHVPKPADSKTPARAIAGPALHAFAFAAIWMAVEWWRGWFLTGFPWNPAGSVWVAVPALLQGASIIGVYGLSFVTVAAAASSAWLFTEGGMRRGFGVLAVCHLPLAIIALFGIVRLSGPPPQDVPDVTLRLIQPNIAQAEKWLPDARARHVIDQVRMSTTNAAAVTHVLWAETAVPFALNAAPQALEAAAAASPAGGVLLTGAPRLQANETGRNVYNSLFAITDDGTFAATYDKAHLVPFGEYMPLQDLIPIPQLTGGSGFSAGPGAQTIDVGTLPPFSPLICYEIIFPGAVTNPSARPAWLFNLTNDAWFGDSSGPYQHLAAAQLRAVEEGLPVVRVANTGISAVINARGHIEAHLPLLRAGVLDHALPGAVPPTFFSLYGHTPVLGLGALVILISVFLGRRGRKSATHGRE